MAATLAMSDPSYARYLVRTYDFWLKRLVDTRQLEVWHMLTLPDHRPRYPKVHQWKNAYHSFEHALVAYLTTQAMRRETATLYYAFETDALASPARPYLFMGNVEAMRVLPASGSSRTRKVEVTFKDIH